MISSSSLISLMEIRFNQTDTVVPQKLQQSVGRLFFCHKISWFTRKNAKILDPEFKVIKSTYPFVIGRLLAYSSPDMRKILRELVICNDGSIRWNRLECLVAAIPEQASAEFRRLSRRSKAEEIIRTKIFRHAFSSCCDKRSAIVHIIRKRAEGSSLLLQDIIRVFDISLEEKALDLNKKINLKEEGPMKRVGNGFKGLSEAVSEAVKLAPGMWAAMLKRMSRKSEVHSYALDIVSSLSTHFGHKLTQTCWILFSKLLHYDRSQ